MALPMNRFKLCVLFASSIVQNKILTNQAESSGHSVLSMDFGFCSREEDESNKLTCLFLHDRATQMMAGIPTPQKGGKWLQYLTTEVVRFVVLTQHQELAMKTNRGPSILAL
jgi:hypothetical protein